MRAFARRDLASPRRDHLSASRAASGSFARDLGDLRRGPPPPPPGRCLPAPRERAAGTPGDHMVNWRGLRYGMPSAGPAAAAVGDSMTAILGISAFYHDSAAALIVDGEIVAAAQEERFTRVKHDHAFPKKATEYCLREAGLTASQLDGVVFY